MLQNNLTLIDLKKMVKPYADNQPYYRPFVCTGDHLSYDVFAVGINPATPIYESDIDVDKYVELLVRSNEFYKEYQSIREKTGKMKISRTRMALANLTGEISTKTGKAVLETNVIPFPTSNVKELKQVPREVLEKAEKIFYRVLTAYTPKVIIVHSKASLQILTKILEENNLISLAETDLKKPMKAIEESSPFIEFRYSTGKKGAIFACRHLIYYGKNGNSFAEFRENVIHYLKNHE